MSNEKMREEFEAWICGLWPGVSISRNPDNAAMFAGSYRDERVHMAWKAWQASRAAIEVDLSTLTVTHDTDTNHEPCGDDLFYEDEVKTLIESLGLKVKP